MIHKKNYIFWSAGRSILRAEYFSCGLDVLYGGPRISKLHFLIKKKIINKKFSFLFFGHRNPGSGSGTASGSGFTWNAWSDPYPNIFNESVSTKPVWTVLVITRSASSSSCKPHCVVVSVQNKIKALETQNRTLAAQLRRLHQIVVNGGELPFLTSSP